MARQPHSLGAQIQQPDYLTAELFDLLILRSQPQSAAGLEISFGTGPAGFCGIGINFAVAHMLDWYRRGLLVYDLLHTISLCSRPPLMVLLVFHNHQPFNRRRRSLPNHFFRNPILDRCGFTGVIENSERCRTPKKGTK
jgi:hypothetical protein